MTAAILVAVKKSASRESDSFAAHCPTSTRSIDNELRIAVYCSESTSYTVQAESVTKKIQRRNVEHSLRKDWTIILKCVSDRLAALASGLFGFLNNWNQNGNENNNNNSAQNQSHLEVLPLHLLLQVRTSLLEDRRLFVELTGLFCH